MLLRNISCFLLCLPFLGWSQTPEISSILADYMNGLESFSGSVMVASAGKPIFMEGYGMVNEDQPIDVNTLFDIGSITKPFTATAILKLSEAGKLSVSNAISNYFPDLPEEKGGITIHQLLTHSSGLPGALGSDYDQISREGYLKEVAACKSSFQPGASYEYSNVGYSLLAMIIESLTEKSYDNFLREDVIFPAKMLMTGYSPQGIDYMAIASGIDENENDWGSPRSKVWDGDQPGWHLRGNGGLLSSASDMFRFYRALRNDRLLGAEAVKAQFKPHVDEGEGSYYGYGWVVLNNGNHITHNGGNGIFHADFHWLPTKDISVFVVSNDANAPVFDISEDILEMVLSGEPIVEINFEEVDFGAFPANEKQELAKQYLDLVNNPDSAKAKTFIEQHFSPGVIERNSIERLTGLFDVLHGDHPNLKIESVQTSENHLKLITTHDADQSKLILILNFLGDQIDGLNIELEN